MKTIAIIATGGTIAGRGASGKTTNYQAGRIPVSEILKSIPDVSDRFKISLYSLMSIDSNEMDLEQWLLLKMTVEQLAASDEVDGIVITHGTDTIEETAYFLTLTIHTEKPVVLTGAMRPATAASADGPFNLYQAICLAGSSKAIGQGVLALFSSTIYSGRDIQKISNYKIDAFDKANTALGFMKDDEIYFNTKLYKKHTCESIFSTMPLDNLPQVDIVTYFAGAKASLLDTGAQGVVIMGSGMGNYSKAWYEEMKKLNEKGVIFVRSSRVVDGIVFGDDVFDPAHICVNSLTLSAHKSRILLMLSLACTKKLSKIQEIFTEY
jgi:L-asparaginase